MPRKVRDYKAEYKQYHSQPEQKKNRAKRNAARDKMEQEGRVRKGDGKDVDHKRGVKAGNSSDNLRVMDKKSNRSFERNKDGSVKRRKK